MRNIRSDGRATRYWPKFAFFMLALSLWLMTGRAQAQETTSCDGSVKTAVVAAVTEASKSSESQQLALQAKLYEQYKACGTKDAANLSAADPFFTAVRECGAAAGRRGSLYYEEMACCAYDPQRRSFACPIKIKRPFGFGAAPLPGSREYVLNCVRDPSGIFVPMGTDSVHLADSKGSPSWEFAVITSAVSHLDLVQPMSGATQTARSILSWELRPTDCYYQPIWGDAIDYNIRLDQ